MPRVKPEQRQKMEADGKWGLFKARKTALQGTDGCTPAEAHRRALAEFYSADNGVPAPSRAEAVKVTALERKMTEVGMLFLGYLPDGYGNQRPSDPLGQAWNDAMNALVEAEDRLEVLGEVLREMAGITWEEARAAIAEPQEQPATAEPVSA